MKSESALSSAMQSPKKPIPSEKASHIKHWQYIDTLRVLLRTAERVTSWSFQICRDHVMPTLRPLQPQVPQVIPGGELRHLVPDEVKPSANNPRHLFDPDQLMELKKNIAEH